MRMDEPDFFDNMLFSIMRAINSYTNTGDSNYNVNDLNSLQFAKLIKFCNLFVDWKKYFTTLDQLSNHASESKGQKVLWYQRAKLPQLLRIYQSCNFKHMAIQHYGYKDLAKRMSKSSQISTVLSYLLSDEIPARIEQMLFNRRFVGATQLCILPHHGNVNSGYFQLISDGVNFHLDLLNLCNIKKAKKYLNNLRHNVIYHNLLYKYKLFLQSVFFDYLQKYNNLNENINRTYNLFIYLVTHPSSPQIWRRIRINGQISLCQFDEILCNLFFGNRGHNYEFRFNLNMNSLIKCDLKYIEKNNQFKQLFSKNGFKFEFDNIDNGCLIITNLNIPNHIDRVILRLNKQSTISMDMQQILMGQLLSLYYFASINTTGYMTLISILFFFA